MLYINKKIYFRWYISIISGRFSKQILYPQDLKDCKRARHKNYIDDRQLIEYVFNVFSTVPSGYHRKSSNKSFFF